MIESRLIHGDALEELRKLPSNSVDAIITDPPAGIEFMGKSWDADKGGRDSWIAWLSVIMREALRVLKPGGHALVWSLPRTSHWTATALEDAGFEIRDSIEHVFGSGFPKSHNISKAIDKMRGAERETIGTYIHPATNKTHGGFRTDNERNAYSSFSMCQDKREITAPATQDAQTWDGWGTALKPAHETWWLCRKSIEEDSIAANVLEWGCGALNIDATRINIDEVLPNYTPSKSGLGKNGVYNASSREQGANSPTRYDNRGRWPANFLLSHTLLCNEEDGCAEECPVAEMDRQSGIKGSNARPNCYGKKYQSNDRNVYSELHADYTAMYNDQGGASRYFARFYYTAKASRRERNANGTVNNTHPTVKPAYTLMRYLCRLITPPDGVVLDPFMGSGSTGIACVYERFNFIGIEKELAYVEIARARINHALTETGDEV